MWNMNMVGGRPCKTKYKLVENHCTLSVAKKDDSDELFGIVPSVL